MNPPDWNWADFCGKSLCIILHDFKDSLSKTIIKKIENSIICACESIIKRDTDAGYTNIALMDCYVTIMAGQLMDIGALKEYGRKKLKRIYEIADFNGGFSEHNSPTYTMVVLGDLSAMQNHINDEESRYYIDKLADMEWECIALHWHVKTNQWTGPHSRCYSTFLEEEILKKIQNGVPDVKLADGNEIISYVYGSDWKCSQKYIKYFTDPRESFDTRKFVKDKSEYINTENVYIHPDYALGSFEVSDFWNQRRNLICYYGTKENPSYMHLRFLHDGYDFTTVEMNGVQKKNMILGTFHFANNSGDDHLVFNKIKDKTITADDIRMRFEIGGFCGDIPKWDEGKIVIKDKGICISINVAYACLGNQKAKYEVSKEDNKLYADVILFKGNHEKIVLQDMLAAVAAGVSINTEMPHIEIKTQNDMIEANYVNAGLIASGSIMPLEEEILRERMSRNYE